MLGSSTLPWPHFTSYDDFALVITGTLEVSSTGSYDFLLGSDDGSLLYIDGVERINNDGQHAYSVKKETISLVAGQIYSLEIRFFEHK